ncbi:hypothetical protein Bbelb_447340 [Branchiostoma belcheri]|nr:hypothetical protein Bbelb_447340 [Branchiostoma belcheri]
MAAVRLGGSVFSALSFQQVCSHSDQVGLLFGEVSVRVKDSISDSQINSKTTEKTICVLSPCHVIYPPQHIVGWYRFRRNSSPEPSLWERIIHRKLSETLKSQENMLFWLFTYQSSGTVSTHVTDYTLYQQKDRRLQAIPHAVVNLGDTSHDHYRMSSAGALSTDLGMLGGPSCGGEGQLCEVSIMNQMNSVSSGTAHVEANSRAKQKVFQRRQENSKDGQKEVKESEPRTRRKCRKSSSKMRSKVQTPGNQRQHSRLRGSRQIQEEEPMESSMSENIDSGTDIETEDTQKSSQSTIKNEDVQVVAIVSRNHMFNKPPPGLPKVRMVEFGKLSNQGSEPMSLVKTTLDPVYAGFSAHTIPASSPTLLHPAEAHGVWLSGAQGVLLVRPVRI